MRATFSIALVAVAVYGSDPILDSTTASVVAILVFALNLSVLPFAYRAWRTEAPFRGTAPAAARSSSTSTRSRRCSARTGRTSPRSCASAGGTRCARRLMDTSTTRTGTTSRTHF